MINNITKPKLIFFQWKSAGVSNFVLLHRQQHVKCLSEFFDVIVINEDCDYQQICDKYKPDLTLFESGVNYRRCQRLEIKNTYTYPEIPKLGFHNGDSWCEARAGFLSDMEHWGIETFFSICTTTAEHTPEMAENLFVWPNFIDTEIFRDYKQSKIIPVMLNGAINPLYPWRQKISKIISQYYPSLICPHLGYIQQSTSRMLQGEQYARTINSSWFVPTCGSVEKELVRKHFEIPGSNSCLVTERTSVLELAGFIDMHNCIFADERDVLDKLDYLFQNPDKLEKITNTGYQLVHSRHTLKQRDQIFQWFNLYKNLKPHQKIIQKNPFDSLTIVERSSEIQTLHVICNGLVIDLLQQGDEKLWDNKYEEAERLYLQCLNYTPLMPAPKLRLTLCNLHKGNPEKAIDWILQPIKYTLDEYKAIDPDPVEWAYFIISLICQGKLDEATNTAYQFPLLCHPELERTRWLINVLNNKGNKDIVPCIPQSKYRYSVHQLPNKSLEHWIENICIMLKACHQFRLAEILNVLIDLEYKSLKQQQTTIRKKNDVKNNYKINKFKYFTYYNTIFKSWLNLKIKPLVGKSLRYLESIFGCFLPYQISQIKFDDFFWAIRSLTSGEDIKTALIIGASAGEGGTESILAGIQENPNKPIVFCMNVSTPGFIKLQKRCANNDFIKCYTVAPFTEEIEKSIKIIKQENKINLFDVVFIDSSEFYVNFALDEVYGARFVLLDDINTFQNYKNHHKLLADPNYFVDDQNPSLRNGYAIFKKVNSNEVITQSACNIAQ